MQFYNIDQHISVISDLQDIFGGLGHRINSDSLSGHHWVMNKERAHVPVVERNLNTIIENEVWREFHDLHKEKLSTYDGFVVTYPPIFSMFYKEFERPTIVYIPVRYDLPYTDNAGMLEIFNKFLGNKNIILVANNMIDKLYTEDRTGLSVEYIPDLCEYTKMKWEPKRDEFLLYDGSRRIQIGKTVNRYEMPHPHTWKEIQSFKGIIHFPYQVSTMSFFEQYSAGIPLFYPSKELLIKLWNKKQGVLNQCFWTKTQHGKYGFETMEEVINHADYYSGCFPHVIHFDSLVELEDKMYDDSFLQWTHDRMLEDNVVNRESVYQKWNYLLKGIKS